MAEIIAKFDTKTKELTLSMDGQSVPNVMSVSLSKAGGYYDEETDKNEFGCSILTLEKIKDDGYKTYTNIIASATKEGKQAIAEGAKLCEFNHEFVKHQSLSLAQTVLRKFLGASRHVSHTDL